MPEDATLGNARKGLPPHDGDVGREADEQEGGGNAEGSCGNLLLDANACCELCCQCTDHSNHGQPAVDGLRRCKIRKDLQVATNSKGWDTFHAEPAQNSGSHVKTMSRLCTYSPTPSNA